jgi:hypothetical protein
LLGKAPPYLSSLVTIRTHNRSTHSSRYISLVIPKANTSFGRLSFQFSAANDWNELQKSLKLETYISLPILFLFTFLLFCAPVFLLAHHHLLIYRSNVNLLNCKLLLLWPIYCLTSSRHLHTLYIDFWTVLLTVRLFIPCLTLCCCLSRTALLYLGQVAVVNENLFSTSLPGYIKVKSNLKNKINI